MKFENNWKHKSLESLEKNIWPPLDSDEGSYLIKTCNQLRKKQLENFTTEDLRIIVGQSIGLKFLIPLAIEILKTDILAEGDLYEGDLLQSVLLSDKDYWRQEKDNWVIVCQLFNQSRENLETADTTSGIRKRWFESFKEFEKIN
jgi:hypothetical protein